jgi:DNA-binding CsgD family transcriptional regulator
MMNVQHTILEVVEEMNFLPEFLETAALVARGLSSQDIARKQGISRGIASARVATLLRSTKVQSESAFAALILEALLRRQPGGETVLCNIAFEQHPLVTNAIASFKPTVDEFDAAVIAVTGVPIRALASTLGRSVDYAESILRSIYRKAGVSSRLELVAFVISATAMADHANDGQLAAPESQVPSSPPKSS